MQRGLLDAVCPADRAGERPALTHPESGIAISYAQLRERVLTLCSGLGRRGARAGDRVLVVTRNDVDFLPLLIACAQRNLIVVPVGPDLLRHQYNVVIAHADPRFRILLGGSAQLPRLRTNDVELSVDELLGDGDAADSAPAPDVDATSLLIYTSGTTGTPKGVMLSQSNLTAGADNMARFYSLGDTDAIYTVLPFYHANPITVSGLPCLVGGGHLVIGPVFGPTTAKFYWTELAAHAPTWGSVTPSIMAMLVRIAAAGRPALPPGLRGFLCGGSALGRALCKEFETGFGGKVYAGYGLTETTTWITATPLERPLAEHGAGVSLEGGVDIRIDPAVGPSGDTWDRRVSAVPVERERRSSRQGIGEIVVRGPVVTAGYYRDKRLTNTVFTADGWLRTGDLGYFDTDGQLHVTGRSKEIIKRKSINIDPVEIDALIADHPAVVECKTFGVPDELMGEKVVTAVVCEPARVAEIRTWGQRELPPGLVPNTWLRTRFIPKGAAGKPLLALLRGIATGTLAGEIAAKLAGRTYSHHKPSDEQAVVARLQAALVGEPLTLLMLWGCGKRSAIAQPDELAIQRLAEIRQNIRVVADVNCQITLVMTDVHARLNGHAPAHYTRYHDGVRAVAERAGFQCSAESEIWSRAEIDPAQAEAQLADPAFQREWDELPEPVRERLVSQAAKHSSSPDNERAARRYISACRIERPLITRQFEGAILLTYNGPEFDFCVADLPRMYIHPHTRSSTAKPWFS